MVVVSGCSASADYRPHHLKAKICICSMFHATGLTLFWFSFVKQIANCGLCFISTDGSYKIHCPVPQDIKGSVNQSYPLLLYERIIMLRLCTSTLLGLLLVVGSVAIHENATLPVRYNVTFLQGDGERCPSAEQREAVKANISQDLRALLRDVHVPVRNPELYSCGGFGTGWARIAYLNMSELTQQCPHNWSLITSPRRTCGRSTGVSCSSPSVPCTCDSATFSNYQGIQYSRC